jgi:hypothetical protein
MPLRTAKIVRVSRAEAEAFMLEFEHLGNVGLGVWHFGMLIEERLTCVLSFGVPCFSMSRGVIGELATKHGVRVLQLCRGGTSAEAPRNSPSRAIGLTLRVIQKQFGNSMVVAYADPVCREVGTIYQACNAIHTGWTKPKGQANYILHGRRLSAWTVRRRYGTRSLLRLKEIDPKVIIEQLRPKIRYLLVAASGSCRRKLLHDLQSLHRPYPKREVLDIASMKLEGPTSEAT